MLAGVGDARFRMVSSGLYKVLGCWDEVIITGAAGKAEADEEEARTMGGEAMEGCNGGG